MIEPKNNNDLVSIVIPCYRDSALLPFAIESVYRQTYKNIEIIVINDGSPETAEIEKVVEKFPSIVYVRNEINQGLAATRNVGIKMARGSIVGFLDADDEYHPCKIELQIKYVDENTAVACDLQELTSQISPVMISELDGMERIEVINNRFKISYRNYLTGASILASRELLLKIGGYEETLRSCEDYDLWLRLIGQGIKVVRIRKPLYFYRFNPEGLSKNINEISFWELEVVRSNLVSIGNTWFSWLFQISVLITWFLRHLLWADEKGSSELKKSTLIASRKYSQFLVIYPIIFLVDFFCIPRIFSIFVKYKTQFSSKLKMMPSHTGVDPIDGFAVSNGVIWGNFFIYSMATAILFQLLMPFLLPSLHGGQGLLSQDAVYFHQSAMTLAADIQRSGWSAWRPWPSPYTTGNVAILGAIYAIFGAKPILLLPLNAALHACGGLCLIFIGRHLFPGNFAKLGSLIAGCLYLIFPSSLNWYAQNHKDEYAALGFLMLLLAGLRVIKAKKLEELPFSIFLTLCGLALTIFVRPNNLQLFIILGLGAILICPFFFFKNKIQIISLTLYASLILLSSVDFKVSPHQESTTPQNVANGFAQSWEWQISPEIPRIIDNTVKKLANIRVFMAANAIRDGAGSMIDAQQMPNNFYGVLKFLPTAGLHGLFAPYPPTWTSKKSAFWVVGVLEISIWYMLSFGMFWLLWRQRDNLALWWTVFCTFTILSTESFLVSNLGTLHRIRYPFLFVFILLGCIGWSCFLKLLLAKSTSSPLKRSSEPQLLLLRRPENINWGKIYQVLPLMLVTGLLLIGLFFRDLLFAHVFGLGSVMDTYQHAANLPLAAAALFAVPLGPALVVQFSKLHTRDIVLAKRWVQAMSGILLLSFLIVGLISLAIPTIEFFGYALGDNSLIILWFFPLVLLSGITVLGNAVMICNKQALLSVSFQFAVPISGMFLVYFFGEHQLGVIAPVAGLVFGQMINLVMVAYCCSQSGYTLAPKFGRVYWHEWRGTYISLVAAGIITGLSIPIALHYSAELPQGSIAVFYMGSKIFQSVSMFVSLLFLSLVLPFFIHLGKGGQSEAGNATFRKFFIVGVFTATLVSLLVYIIAPEVSLFFFLGKKIGFEQVNELSRVIQLGSLQLPFFVISITIIKYLISLSDTWILLFATLIGQVVNFCILTFVVHLSLDVSILTLGVTSGLAASAFVLTLWTKVKNILGWKEFYYLFLILLVFVAMVSSLLFSNFLGLFFTFVIFISLPLLFRAMNHPTYTELNPI